MIGRLMEKANVNLHQPPIEPGRFSRETSPTCSLGKSGAALVIVISMVFLAGCIPGRLSDQPTLGVPSPVSILTQTTQTTQAPLELGENPSATPAKPLQQPASTSTPSLTPIPLPTPNPWTGETRVNILLLGVDYGDWNSPDRAGPPRSDTMILFTIDPQSKTAGMLSIPRDLWVDIPGMLSPNRINTAHRFGEQYELPGGGPALAARTVENLLGVSVHYYARIDFSAFERLIDELGGVEVDVPEELTIDPIGSGNTLTLTTGKHTLDGAAALAYARSRSTPGDETDRANRQQQIIMAIRDQVLQLNNLPLLVYKAPSLYSQLSAGITTNLSLDEAIQLAWLAAKIDPNAIQSAIIGPNQYTMTKTEEGWDVFMPIPERIHWLVQQIFSP